ncbi:MAG: hypothetical protein ACXVNR_13000 [Bacteroidia bacterium]
MKAIKKTKRVKAISKLKLIKGGLYLSAKKAKRINDFWNFCHAALWPNLHFTKEQQEGFKHLIASHFADCDTRINARFKELVERATLTKQLKRSTGIHVAQPDEWLSINYRYGLSSTSGWPDELKERRSIVPCYSKGTALLAKALLEYSKLADQSNVIDYRKQFIELKNVDLLALYTNAVMYMYFNF